MIQRASSIYGQFDAETLDNPNLFPHRHSEGLAGKLLPKSCMYFYASQYLGDEKKNRTNVYYCKTDLSIYHYNLIVKVICEFILINFLSSRLFLFY